jgi:hypothetical protein
MGVNKVDAPVSRSDVLWVGGMVRARWEIIGQRQIRHRLTCTVKRVQRIPWLVRSGGGGRRIGHLTCATAPKSSGRNWNFGLRKKKKCTIGEVRRLKWRHNN